MQKQLHNKCRMCHTGNINQAEETEMVDMIKKVSMVKRAPKIDYSKPAKVNMVKRINYTKAA